MGDGPERFLSRTTTGAFTIQLISLGANDGAGFALGNIDRLNTRTPTRKNLQALESPRCLGAGDAMPKYSDRVSDCDTHDAFDRVPAPLPRTNRVVDDDTSPNRGIMF